MPAADDPALKRELGRPEGEQGRTAKQLQLASAAGPAGADAPAREAVDRLPVRHTERAGAGLGRLDHGDSREHPLARLEGTVLKQALGCLPAAHGAETVVYERFLRQMERLSAAAYDDQARYGA